jgi:hypothetical protein
LSRRLPLYAAALCSAAALAAPESDPDAVTFDPAGAVKIAGARLDDGGVVAEIGAAVVVPVKRRGQTVGVGFVGDGTFALTFPDRADAQRFANRQVLLGKRPAADLVAIAHGEAPFTTTVSRGFVFGSNEVLAPWLGGEATDGAAAASTLSARLELLDGRVDLSEGRDAGVGADRWLFADFLGAQRLHYVRPSGTTVEDDRWLSLYRDDVDGWPPADVLAIGRDAHGDVRSHTLALGRWVEPPDPGEGPLVATNGIETVRVDATVEARAMAGRAHVAMKVDATYVLKAHRELASVEVEVPRVESAKGTWSVQGVYVDGAAVPAPAGLDKGVHLALPTALARGDDVSLRIVYVDSWALGIAGGDLGRATTPRSPLPWLPGTHPADFALKVGVDAEAKVVQAQSGLTVREWEADGLRWVESKTDGRPVWPVVAFGDWATVSEPSVQGLPAIRVNLFRDEAQGIAEFPPFLRTIVAYYQNILPPFPTGELELLQQRDGMGRFTWTARQGLVTLQQMQVYGGESSTRAGQPHLEAEVMAHEVAHQWWGSLVSPARAEDRWISETMANVYACLFVGAVYAQKDCDLRRDGWRRTWEKDRTVLSDASLRDAWGDEEWIDVAYEYGPYVMLHMLRRRLGDDAFFGALDGYARDRADRPSTTDRLQAAFEAASGRDLDAFFAFWVVGGFLPSLELSMNGTQGTITSDVPFGEFDVPVYAWTEAGKEALWVDVVDGKGTFELSSKPTRVELDPDGLVLARARKVSRR